MSETSTPKNKQAEQAKTPTCIFLLEDHEAFRRALAFMLNREQDFEVVGEAGPLEEASEGASVRLGEVDLAVMDLLLPDGNSMEMIGELAQDQA